MGKDKKDSKQSQADLPTFRGKSSKYINLVVAKDETDIQIGGYNLRMDLLDGWEDLSDPQQRYLIEFARDPDSKTQTAMLLGYPMSRVNKWFSQDAFVKVAKQINDLYTEFLRGVDYKEAIYNHKVRGRVLKARKADGYHEKQTKEGDKHLHIHNFKDVMKMINGS